MTPMQNDRSHLVGIAIVRGGGVAPVQRRLPRKSPVSLGSRERHGLLLLSEWVPKDVATFTPIDEGWVVENGPRSRMRMESEWVETGSVTLLPHGLAVVQRGETRLTWNGLDKPLSLSVSVRTRRLDDARIPFVVDSTIDGQPVPETGSYLGLQDTPMSAALRYQMAVLFRHLIEGEAPPLHLLKKRSEQLGISEADLDGVAQRYRRRLNALRGVNLDSIEELGEYLVRTTGELTHADLEP